MQVCMRCRAAGTKYEGNEDSVRLVCAIKDGTDAEAAYREGGKL